MGRLCDGQDRGALSNFRLGLGRLSFFDNRSAAVLPRRPRLPSVHACSIQGRCQDYHRQAHPPDTDRWPRRRRTYAHLSYAPCRRLPVRIPACPAYNNSRAKKGRNYSVSHSVHALRTRRRQRSIQGVGPDARRAGLVALELESTARRVGTARSVLVKAGLQRPANVQRRRPACMGGTHR